MISWIGLDKLSNSVSSYLTPGSLKIRSMISFVFIVRLSVFIAAYERLMVPIVYGVSNGTAARVPCVAVGVGNPEQRSRLGRCQEHDRSFERVQSGSGER